jgi:hypothetical protein
MDSLTTLAGRGREVLESVRARPTRQLLGGLAALAVIGVAIGVATRPTTTTVVELFDGDFGRAETGQSWNTERGEWKTSDGRLEVDLDSGTGLAIVDPGQSDGVLSVGVPSSSSRSGVVFRYRDPQNYWSAVAFPAFNGWGIQRVVDGTTQNLQSMPFSQLDNTRLRISLSGPIMSVVVGDRPAVELYDPAAAGATGVGLIASGPAGRARWEDLRFSPAEGSIPDPAPTTAADTFFGDGYLLSAEPGVPWLPAAGAWRATDGTARATADGPDLSLLPIGASDLQMSALVNSAQSAGAGIVARYRDEANHLRLVADPASSRWVLESVEDGEITEVGSVPGPAATRIKLVVEGPTAAIQAGFDVVGELAVPEPGPGALMAGIVSIGQGANVAEVDDFSARPLDLREEGTPTPLTDDFERQTGTGLGTTTTGDRNWRQPLGQWQVVDRAVAPVVEGRSLLNVTVVPFDSNGRLRVTMPVVGDGSGVVFRYLDHLTHWSVSQLSGRWFVRQLVAGAPVVNEEIGVAGPGPTRVDVAFDGAEVVVRIEGQEPETVTGVTAPGLDVGLSYTAFTPQMARWDDLIVGPVR